jgi:hypothetical protein
MSDPTPPPDEALGDQARARIRAELLAATQAPRIRARRWVVPAAAAASVALVAGMTVWATGVVGGDARDGDGIGPAGGSDSLGASPSPEPTSEPTEPGPDTPTSDEGTLPMEPQPEAGSGACLAELEHVLRGAEQAVVFPEDGGTTSYWIKGGRFVLCDERAGTTTVHKPLPLEPDLDDVATFRVSSLITPSKQGFRSIRVAGGLVPEGALAFDVDYTFPDGHVERATTVTDDEGRTWWRMVYAYDYDGGNERDARPIEVSVTLSGSGFGFPLEWGVDTCAQANHGC